MGVDHEFAVRFDTGNAAFEDAPEQEVARILRSLADRVEAGEATGKFQNVHDANGNHVGTWRFIHEED